MTTQNNQEDYGHRTKMVERLQTAIVYERDPVLRAKLEKTLAEAKEASRV